MNDCISEVRATLQQARHALEGLPCAVGSEMRDVRTRDVLDRLTRVLDVLTGEVERLDTATKGLLDLTKNLQCAACFWIVMALVMQKAPSSSEGACER